MGKCETIADGHISGIVYFQLHLDTLTRLKPASANRFRSKVFRRLKSTRRHYLPLKIEKVQLNGGKKLRLVGTVAELCLNQQRLSVFLGRKHQPVDGNLVELTQGLYRTVDYWAQV